MDKKNIYKGVGFALIATAIWSGNFIVARYLSTSFPPITLAFYRWVVALLVFTPFAIKQLIADWQLLRKSLTYLIIISFLGIALFNTLIYVSGHTTTAINLSLISITFPIFIIIITSVFFNEPITLKKLIGVLLVAVGVILIITKGALSVLLNLTFQIGDILMLIAAIIFATYSVLLQKRPKIVSIYSFQFATFILGTVLLFPFYLWEFITTPAPVINIETLTSIAYIGVFASLVAFVLWNKAIEHIGPTKAGMIYYTLPLFSGVLAILILNENLEPIHFYSAVLIVSGIIIGTLKKDS